MDHDRLVKIANNNIEEEISKLTFEEKIQIFASKYYVARLIIYHLIKNKTKIFNEDESITILNNYYEKSGLFYNYYFVKVLPVFDIPNDILIERIIGPVIINNIDSKMNKSLFDILTDEELEKLINREEYKEHIPDIIYLFKSDEYKMRYLSKMSKNKQYNVIKTLSDDNIKKYIKPIVKEKGYLISFLSSDEEKEKYLDSYRLILSDKDKAKIISSFKDNIYKYRNIIYIQSDKARCIYIASSNKEDNEFNRNVILSIQNQKYLTDVIITIGGIYDITFVKNLIDKIDNPNYLYSIYCSLCYSKGYAEYILPKLSQKYIMKYVKGEIEFLSDYHLLLYINDDNIFFEILEHYNFNFDYTDDMLPIFKRVADKYNLNLDHLIELTKITGCLLIRELPNDNIVNTINLDDESFKKYLQIFDEKNYKVNRSSLSSILNSLLNKKFSLDFPNQIQIFINTLHAVDDGNIELAIENIMEVISKVDLDKYNISSQELIDGVLNSDSKVVNIFNTITYEYLTIQRNNYVNSSMNNALYQVTNPEYDINDLVKYMLKIMPSDILLELIEDYKNNANLSQDFQFLNNQDLVISIINYKKKPNNNTTMEVKRNLKKFNLVLKYIFSDYRFSSLHHSYKVYDEGLNINIKPFPFLRTNLLEIMRNINPLKLKEFVFSDHEIFNELLNYLNRYSVIGWQDCFESLTESVDVSMSPTIVGSLISNFEYIMKMKKEKEKNGERFTFISELSLADCLDSDASIYSLLFGIEDYRFLRNNPGPNASPKSKDYRLDKALECLRIMHDRKYITVPPVDKEFQLKDGKSIKVLVGNTNDSINLTYGERTGACMRLGGAGSSLFDFCLKNENGFHISFIDPKTDKLVSRVSCYRNGNTLFLNQLRDSLSKDFSNENIKEACSLIAQELIELTKDSQYPILNVVSSNYYAYKDSKTVDSKCSKSTKGFISSFYTDISQNVVVVATATGSLSSIDLGPNNAEKYEVGRSPIRKYSDNKACDAVAHIEALDEFYSNKTVDEIEITRKQIFVAYVGEDWYVAITKTGDIISYVQKNSRNSKKANQELQEYLKKINDLLLHINMDLGQEVGEIKSERNR